jgi:hypothetical protein
VPVFSWAKLFETLKMKQMGRMLRRIRFFIFRKLDFLIGLIPKRRNWVNIICTYTLKI